MPNTTIPLMPPGAAPAFHALQFMEPGWVSRPFTSAAWDFELACDGYRMLVEFGNGKARMRSRGGVDTTRCFPEVSETLAAVPVGRTVLDGSLCMLDEAGRCDPRRLHERALRPGRVPDGEDTLFCPHDLLVLEGRDVRRLPSGQRRALLRSLPLWDLPRLRAPRIIPAEGEWLHRQALALGRGMIWARRRDAPYQAGRGDGWLLVPCELSEAVAA